MTAKKATSARGSPGMPPWAGASGERAPRTRIQAEWMSSMKSWEVALGSRWNSVGKVRATSMA
eukprot:7847915-Lingulodinium_polyedra.AAC.1